MQIALIVLQWQTGTKLLGQSFHETVAKKSPMVALFNSVPHCYLIAQNSNSVELCWSSMLIAGVPAGLCVVEGNTEGLGGGRERKMQA